MKKLFVLLTILVCVVVIIIGNLHWNKKIAANHEKTAAVKETSPVVEANKTEEIKNGIDLTQLSSNLPIKLQEKMKTAIESNKTLNFVIYGSSEVEGTWSELFSNKIKEAYGENLFNITIITTGDMTTSELINSEDYKKINDLNPDILLFEAPMLSDNGDVGFGINESFDNIKIMTNNWNMESKELVTMIQPSQPLYGAKYYPSEVSQLKAYVEKNDLIYINHWGNWPDLNDEKMLDYLVDNKVNEEGHKLWAEHIINYFVAE